MTFPEITRMMLNSMDFFELRRTAARYSVAYQGVRRQRLIRDIERKIFSKSLPQVKKPLMEEVAAGQTLASSSPEGAVSAKPSLKPTKKATLGTTRINTFSARNSLSRITTR